MMFSAFFYKRPGKHFSHVGSFTHMHWNSFIKLRPALSHMITVILDGTKWNYKWSSKDITYLDKIEWQEMFRTKKKNRITPHRLTAFRLWVKLSNGSSLHIEYKSRLSCPCICSQPDHSHTFDELSHVINEINPENVK